MQPGQLYRAAMGIPPGSREMGVSDQPVPSPVGTICGKFPENNHENYSVTSLILDKCRVHGPSSLTVDAFSQTSQSNPTPNLIQRSKSLFHTRLLITP